MHYPPYRGCSELSSMWKCTSLASTREWYSTLIRRTGTSIFTPACSGMISVCPYYRRRPLRCLEHVSKIQSCKTICCCNYDSGVRKVKYKPLGSFFMLFTGPCSSVAVNFGQFDSVFTTDLLWLSLFHLLEA